MTEDEEMFITTIVLLRQQFEILRLQIARWEPAPCPKWFT